MTKIKVDVPKPAKDPSLPRKDVDALLTRYRSEQFTPEQAAELKRDLEAQMALMDCGSQKQVEHFLTHDLERRVVEPPPWAPGADVGQKVATKSWGDGKVDGREMKQLIKGWSAPPRSQAQMTAMRAQLDNPALDKNAKKELRTFLDRVGVELISAPDYRAHFEGLRQADGTVHATQAKQLVKQLQTAWAENKDLPLQRAINFEKAYGDSKAMFDADARKQIERFIDGDLRKIISAGDLSRIDQIAPAPLPVHVRPPGIKPSPMVKSAEFDTGPKTGSPDYDKNIRDAAERNKGLVSESQMKELVRQWGSTPKTLLDAQQLKAQETNPKLDPKAKKVLADFVEKKLPKRVSDPSFAAEIERSPTGRDGRVGEKGAKLLEKKVTERWSKHDMPMRQLAELENEVRTSKHLAPAGRTHLQGFLRDWAPTLILRQGLSNPRQVDVTWDPPTTHVDGTPLTDLAGYKIFYAKTASGTPVHEEATTDPSAVGYSLQNVPSGTWYVTVKAVNTAGQESKPSDAAVCTVP